jgi:anti-anti-sigma regulatory factor
MKQTKRKRDTAASAAVASNTTATPELAEDVVAAVGAVDVADTADAEIAVTSSAEPAQPVATSTENVAWHRYLLSEACTVRDSVSLKFALLDLIAEPHPVTIDVSAVERIDASAMQVLCAFVRDRKAAGGVIHWAGSTDSFSEAVRLLGLQKALGVPDEMFGGVAA